MWRVKRFYHRLLVDERQMLAADVSANSKRALRWIAPLAGGLAVVVLGVLPAAAAPTGLAPSQAPAQPGTERSVQQWFGARERPLIELNDALVPALTLTTQGSATRAICTRLARAAAGYAALNPVPNARLAVPVAAGTAKFVEGAAVCLRGDLARAQQLIVEGLAERTAAQDQIDGILEGE